MSGFQIEQMNVQEIELAVVDSVSPTVSPIAPLDQRNRFMNGDINSLGKGQDYVTFGREEDFDWAVLLDGHGTNAFINLMRTQDWKVIMTTDDPCTELLKIIETYRFRYGWNSGSTLLMMRAYIDRIETVSIGDSKILIYKNGKLVYKSCEHDSNNVADIARVIAMDAVVSPMKDPMGYVVSPTKMKSYYPAYIIHAGGATIAPTQALGHNDVTGHCPERHTEYFLPEDEMRCILGSDGFSDMALLEQELVEDVVSVEASEEVIEDMATIFRAVSEASSENIEVEVVEETNDHDDLLNMTASELIAKVSARWTQQWMWHWNDKKPEVFTTTRFPANMYDDVGVVVWDNTRPV
jgi:serine/threonine protein phosphatase PrpC